MSIATALIDATVDAVRETDRQLLDAIGRSVPVFDTTAMQQWYDQRDYDAMRRSLMEQMPASLRPTFKPLPAEESTDIYFPLTTATGTYRATGTITINKDLAQGLLKAVETPMLKVGDRVKILRPFTEEEKRKPPHWTPGMSALIGAEGVVDYIGEFVGVRVGKGYSYSWLPETLELIPAADEIAFGPFPSFEEIEAERLDLNYHSPVWEVKSPTGKLSLVRCYPNLGDVDTFASFRDTVYTKSEKFPAFTGYSARRLDRDGKPTERKHIALTVAASSPSIKITDVGLATTVQQPATATAAEVVAAVNASGSRYAGGVSLGEAAEEAALQAVMASINKHTNSVPFPCTAIPPLDGAQVIIGPSTATTPDKHGTFFSASSDAPVYMHKVTVYPAAPAKLSTDQERKIADALRRLPIGSDHAAKPRGTDARAAERLAQAAQAAKKEQWRDFPTVEEVRAAPFTVWAVQRPNGSVFYGYFVTAEQYIYLQQCTDKGVFLEGTFSEPFSVLHDLKARPVVEEQTDIKCNALVRIAGVPSDLDELEHGTVIETTRSTFGGRPLCTVRSDDRKRTVTVPLRDLTFEYKNFAGKIAAQVERKAAEAEARRDPLVQDVKLICKAIPAKEGFAASQIHHDVAYTTAHYVAEVRGTSDRPLGEVLTRTPTTTGERWVICSDDPEKVAAAPRTIADRTNPLTSATTSATIPKQLGATMPTTEVKSTSRMRRAITEATRRAPVELGLNQAHEAIVKQAAKKFKGTAAEKKVVARFLTDLLGSEYGKAGLAAALATVIPQLAPLLGKHEGKADVLAEELATRSATILAVKAGSDLISLLGPLTAILSDMISNAEPQPQITAGSGRSALDEISVTAAPVAATAKR